MIEMFNELVLCCHKQTVGYLNFEIYDVANCKK